MMNSLLAKVEYINTQCEDPEKRKKKKEEEKNWDDFTRLRKKVAADLRKLREDIAARNDLMSKSDMANTTTVRMGRDIRNGLKEVIKEIDQLETMQKTDEEKLERRKLQKKEIKPEEEEEIAHRKEVIDLCREHIEECKRLEKQVRGGGAYTFADKEANDNNPIITSLPDIDGDEGFQLLRIQDDAIDAKLDQISKGVVDLKDIAVQIGNEIDKQTEMLDVLDDSVNKANNQLNNLNKQLKKTLQNFRRADRFCIDIVLLIVLLALGAYLYNAFA